MALTPSPTPDPVSRTKREDIPDYQHQFLFHYRTAGKHLVLVAAIALPNKSTDYLERVGIVTYPPPLYLYAWGSLDLEERKQALKELQLINKEHVHQALEAKGGQLVPKPGKDRKKDKPKEWRAWTKMYVWERELTFNTLKVRHAKSPL